MANPAMVKGGPPLNPGGRAKRGFTWQDYNDRAYHLLDKFSPAETVELSKSIKKLDAACSSFDALIVKKIAWALENGADSERLLDRLIGKPIQRIGGENPGEGIKINASPSIESLPRELREELAVLMSKIIDATTPPVPLMIDGEAVEITPENTPE